MSKPVIKYRTDWQNKIDRVECLRETEQFVVLPDAGFLAHKSGERREAKRGDFCQYHDSWEEARTYLLTKAEKAVADARRDLEVAKSKLGNIKGMKPPADLVAASQKAPG